ncbi:MAG TPA: DUF2948 family protein [Stellaceae bacterium]|nr:DUF2948 family protein [Stellaceae bacterium]
MTSALRLRAVDADDLQVLSAILQDSLVPVAEMAYLPDEQRFALVANRFRWEPGVDGIRRQFERTLTGLCVDSVVSVQRRGFSPSDGDRILALLALRAEGKVLTLHFAGGSAIRIEVERIACRLDDLGEPWPTRWRPRHPE